MAYLKPQDVTTPIDFEWIGSVFKTKTKKDGGEYQCWEVVVRSRSDNKEHTYDVFDKSYEFGKLGTAKQGQLVRAYRNGDFVNWEVLPMGEGSMDIPRVSPSAQVNAERALTGRENAESEKSTAISLQGYAQQIIPALMAMGEYGDEDLINRAVSLSVKAKDAIDQKAKQLSQS